MLNRQLNHERPQNARRPGSFRAARRCALLAFAALVAGGAAAAELAESSRSAEGIQSCPQFSVEYRNDEYGFRLLLPAEWTGFTVDITTWEGDWVERRAEPAPIGPLIVIRDPRSTPDRPRQEIPLEIYTTAQWALRLAGEYSVGAAGVESFELARNGRHVFVAPARFYYAFPDGWEEVIRIVLECNALVPFEPSAALLQRQE